MKKLITLILLLFANTVFAQNLVPNGDFEYYISCPTTQSQIVRATGWNSYKPSPDYYNACGSSIAGVPTNWMGTQSAASGNGYAGFIIHPSIGGAGEAITRSIVPLAIGVTYEVSMSVSLSDSSKYGLNCIGAYFIDNGITSISTIGPNWNIIPQVSYSSYGPIVNTTGWVRLTKSFIADSTYDNIVISGFGPFSSLIIDTINTSGSISTCYYVDSIVVKVANGIHNMYMDSMICAGDTFNVPYALVNALPYADTNVFRVQLSNPSGSFDGGTIIIGSLTGNTDGMISCVVPSNITPGNNYRLRILSSSAVDSSLPNVRKLSIGVLRPNVANNNNGPVCLGQSLNLYANSTNTGVSYIWIGPSSFNSAMQNPIISSANVANGGDYIVTARLHGCISKDTTTVTVIPASKSNINALATNPVCENDTLFLSATLGANANYYSWSGPAGFTSFSRDTVRINTVPSMSGNYIFSAYYMACTIRDTVTVQIKPQALNRTINSNSPVCVGSTLNLSASSSSTAASYLWTGPHNYMATTASVSITNTNTSSGGKYIVSYFLNGCTIQDSLNVVVNPLPLSVTASSNSPLCEGDTLYLNCTNSTSGVNYSWIGPGSYSSTMQNTVILNSALGMSGDYIVTAANSFGCTSKDTVSVLVKPLPVNVSSVANGPICAGNTLLLSGSTTSSGATFLWSGPNSFSSTLQNPNIVSTSVSHSGNYILAAILNGCVVFDTVYAQIKQIPLVPKSFATTPICIGEDLQLSASTVLGATYSWTSTTGFSSNVQNPVRSSATTAHAGKYYVTATVNGCTSPADSITITVNPAPNITMYPSPKDSICVGQIVTFVSSASNAGTSYTRSWFRNNNMIGGAANANYSTATAANGDEYYTTITVSGVCATPFTDTSNKIVMKVLPWLAPSVSIIANPNTTVLSGTMINFTATPTNGGTKPGYQWTRNGSNITGALSNVWGASTLSNNDQICVDMTSSYLCPNPKTAKSNCIKVSIESTGIVGVWTGKVPSIYPNPTNGVLIIEGVDKGTKIQMTDMLGRVVAKAISTETTTELNIDHLAAGSYMLTFSKANGDRMTLNVLKE